MTDTSKSAADQAASTATAKAGKADVAPPRDAAPGGFGGLTMIKDRVASVVRKLTGGS